MDAQIRNQRITCKSDNSFFFLNGLWDYHLVSSSWVAFICMETECRIAAHYILRKHWGGDLSFLFWSQLLFFQPYLLKGRQKVRIHIMKNACYNKIGRYKNKTMHQRTSQVLLEKVIIIVKDPLVWVRLIYMLSMLWRIILHQFFSYMVMLLSKFNKKKFFYILPRDLPGKCHSCVCSII